MKTILEFASVYFLINTCLTGLRSAGVLSKEVSECIIIGLTAREEGERKGKEEVGSKYVWGGRVLIRCHGRDWKRSSASETRQANKPSVGVGPVSDSKAAGALN